MIKTAQLAAMIKAAKFGPGGPGKRKKPEYVDYSKSLVSQLKPEPVKEGLKGGIGAGITGAALAALIAKSMTDNKKAVAASALLGSLMAVPGYQAGKHDAQSEYSRLLYLRRLGLNRPGEYETYLQAPEAGGEKVLEGGYKERI